MKANQVQSIITSNKEIDIIKDIPYELKLIEINSLEEKKSSFLKISSSFVKNRRINIPVNMYDMSFENEWNLFSKNKTVMDTITKCCTQQQQQQQQESNEKLMKFNINLQMQWIKKIYRNFYIHLHSLYIHYEILEDTRIKNNIMDTGYRKLSGSSKMIKWLKDVCGFDNIKEEEDEISRIIQLAMNGLNGEKNDCSVIFINIFLASTALYKDNIDLFTRLHLSISKNILPSMKEHDIGPNYSPETLIKNDYYLTSLYRQSNSMLSINNFVVNIYSENINIILKKYNSTLLKLYNKYATTDGDKDPSQKKAKLQQEEAEKEAALKEAEILAAAQVETRKNKKKHKKHHGKDKGVKDKKHHPHHHHHKHKKKVSKRMNVYNWLAILKVYKFLPSHIPGSPISLNDQINEIKAKKSFAKSLQLVVNSNEQKVNATTMSYTDFLECIIWYAVKGNVHIPTKEELRHAGHSPTTEGMLHYLTKLIPNNDTTTTTDKDQEEEKIFSYHLVGDEFEPFPNPMKHELWSGYSYEFDDNVPIDTMVYQVDMFLSLLTERINTAEKSLSKKKSKSKSKN